MPNGKPGDHPYTDIVIHGSSAECGAEVSDMVREMHNRAGFAAYRDEVAKLLQDCSTHWGEPKISQKSALERLNAIKIELEQRFQT